MPGYPAQFVVCAGKEKLQVGALVLDAGGNASGCVADLQLAIPANKEACDSFSSPGAKYGIGFWRPGSGIMHQLPVLALF